MITPACLVASGAERDGYDGFIMHRFCHFDGGLRGCECYCHTDEEFLDRFKKSVYNDWEYD